MTLTDFRKTHNIDAKELASILGLSESFLKNNGGKNLEELSTQLQASLKIFAENKELKSILAKGYTMKFKDINYKNTLNYIKGRDNEQTILSILSKIEIFVEKNHQSIKNDDFLIFGFDEPTKININEFIIIFNEINDSYLEVDENIIINYFLLKAVGAEAILPKESIYKKVFEDEVENRNVADFNEYELELIKFELVNDKNENTLFFDGIQHKHQNQNLIFVYKDNGLLDILNTSKINTDTATFYYFFYGDNGFIRADYQKKFKSFKSGDEVVKKTTYDEFETVDYYTL